MRFKYLIVMALMVSMAACSTEKKEGTAEETTEKADSCMYGFSSQATQLGWTAYKFTEKAGVSGTFKQYTVTPAMEKASSVAVLMEGMEFSVVPGSVNSGDMARDPKIVKFFFGTMVDSVIQGKIKNVTIGVGGSGKCEIELLMNGQTSSVLGEVVVNGMEVTLKTELDMNAWNAQESVTALNNECKELHTGKDGISILWPNVSVNVTSTLQSFNCDNEGA